MGQLVPTQGDRETDSMLTMKFKNQIFLIRHAESEANTRGILCGQIDVGLSDRGLGQAAQLRNLVVPDDSLVFSSPLIRAWQTARHLAFKTKLHSVPDLMEINMGAYSELSYDEFYRRHPELQELYKFPDFRFPEGESLEDARMRVQRFVDEYDHELKNRNVVIVAHGGILNILMLEMLKLDLNHFPLCELHNCKVNTLTHFEGKFRILSINREIDHDK